MHFGRIESVRDMERTGIEPPSSVDGVLVFLFVVIPGEGGLDAQGVGVEGSLPETAYLVVHQVIRLGHTERRFDAHRHPVKVSGTRLGHVVLAVNLLVLLALLVVEVGLQRQFGAAEEALEASLMVEGEVLQRADLIHLVDRLAAPQTGALVGIHGQP